MQDDPIIKATYESAYAFTRPLVEAFPPVDRAIPNDAVNPITDAIQMFVAEVMQAWIDAGSERDVTMENEELRNAIHAEVKGWSKDAIDNA